jgi:hypothetical protein
MSIWVVDRMFCSFWRYISFPYLHSIWHVIILFIANEAIVICAYLVIIQKIPKDNIHIYTWPFQRLNWYGLPYIKFDPEDENNTIPYKSSNSVTEKFSGEIIKSNHMPIELYSNSNNSFKQSTKIHSN